MMLRPLKIPLSSVLIAFIVLSLPQREACTAQVTSKSTTVIVTPDDKRDYEVIEPVLTEILRQEVYSRYYVSKKKAKLLLDDAGYKGFQSKNRYVVVGNRDKVSEEYRKIEQRHDYMRELDMDYKALSQAFPDCKQIVTAKRPQYFSDGSVRVHFYLDPTPHGSAIGTCTLEKRRGRWRITNYSVDYPG